MEPRIERRCDVMTQPVEGRICQGHKHLRVHCSGSPVDRVGRIEIYVVTEHDEDARGRWYVQTRRTSAYM